MSQTMLLMLRWMPALATCIELSRRVPTPSGLKELYEVQGCRVQRL